MFNTQVESEVSKVAMSAAKMVDQERSDYVKYRIADKIRDIMNKQQEIQKIADKIKEIKSELTTLKMMDIPEAYEKLQSDYSNSFYYVGSTSSTL